MAPAPVCSFSFNVHQSSSWWRRIRENARLLVLIHPMRSSSANGAALHLLEARRSPASARAQTVSLLLHATLGAALVLAVLYAPAPRNIPIAPSLLDSSLLEYVPPARRQSLRVGRDGGGGNSNPVPPTPGSLAPFARVQLLPPRLPDGQHHPLAVQPTLEDDRAPDVVPLVTNLGSPAANDITNSAGPGRNGIGRRGSNGMGDLDGGGNGVGDTNGTYSPGVTPVLCAYCPDPPYADEARKAKLQGTVTLRVLVGTDGRASEIRVVAPLGLGLDERAVETVRTWRFMAAKDAAHNPVASWVTVEAIFRLF